MDVTPRWTAICWLHGRDDKVTTIPPTDGSSNTQPGPFIKHFINHFRIRIFCTGCNYKPILLVLNLFNSLKCLLVGQLVGSCIMCWLIILFHGSYDIFLPDANLAPNTLVVEIIRPVLCRAAAAPGRSAELYMVHGKLLLQCQQTLLNVWTDS